MQKHRKLQKRGLCGAQRGIFAQPTQRPPSGAKTERMGHSSVFLIQTALEDATLVSFAQKVARMHNKPFVQEGTSAV